MATARKTTRARPTAKKKTPVARKRSPAASASAKTAASAAALARTALIPAAKKARAPKKPAKKPKMVRDSFTIPKAEYTVIDALKARATGFGTSVKKSELLRAGLMALAAMGDDALRFALGNVPAIKTGRPKLSKN